jgi:hypothetical protein
MTRITLSDIEDDKPVKLTIEIPARLYRRLGEYAVAINDGEKQGAPEPALLVGPMLDRFIASDRAFARLRKSE